MNSPNYYNYLQRPFQPQLLKGYQVASIDEAKAANIDFDGSVFIFPDLTNRKIYTKQIMIDGTLAFNIYDLATTPTQQMLPQSEFVTRAELQELLGLTRDKDPQDVPQNDKKREIIAKF